MRIEKEYGVHKVFHNGLVFTKDEEDSLNQFISKCWDSLPKEKQLSINEKLRKENKG